MKKIFLSAILFAALLFTACENRNSEVTSDNPKPDTVEQNACSSCAGCESSSDCPASAEESEEVKNLDEGEFAPVETFGNDFEEAGADFESASDEFQEVGDGFEGATEDFEEAGDEFESTSDEFQEAKDVVSGTKQPSEPSTSHISGIPKLDPGLELVLWIFAFTVLAGILQYFKAGRKTRYIFLLFTLLWLGFYRGACPCMISSLQNFIFMLKGNDIYWTSYLWFLGLIPISYVFGRVWCGWACHLGAVQELLYRVKGPKLLQSEKAQKILKYSRIFFFLLLIGHILITNTNYYVTIDPFKGLFNLYVSNITMGILLGLLLVSSIFINRPFCRAACPVGLILGWVSLIPGASILKTGESCNSCNRCEKACDNGAIYKIEKISELNNQDCIRCGDCIDDCKKGGIRPRISKGFTDFKHRLCKHE